jgi:hypothetical protein
VTRPRSQIRRRERKTEVRTNELPFTTDSKFHHGT